MLRAFLPVAPAIVIVEFFFEHLEASLGLNPIVETGLTSATAAVVVAVIVHLAARDVSRELDAAQSERERFRRDADLAAIVHSSSEAIYAIRPDGTIMAWNASAERLYGYSRDEALGQSARMLVPATAAQSQTDSRERIVAGLQIQQVEAERVHKDGSRVLVSLSESPVRDADGGIVGVSVISHDVTAQRRAERALLESEQRFRQIAENIHEVFWLTDPAKNEILYVSPAYSEIWQRDPSALSSVPQAWLDAIHPDDRTRVREGALTRQGQVTSDYSEEYRIVRPDGSIRWIWDRAFPVRDPDGKITRVAGVAEDITERKSTADALRESERRFSSMLGNLHLNAVMLDTEAGVTYCNDYFLGSTGWTREEVLGRNWFDLFIPPGLEDISEVFSALVADMPKAWHHENEILTRAGARLLVRWNNSVLRSSDGTVIGVASIGEDMTDRRRTEEQLRQAQKMEAVGRLAGGVAHDFNNTLGVILGYTELMLRKADETQRGRLEQILKATERAGVLTRQLLAFSRKQVVHPKILDLGNLLGDLKPVLARMLGEDIDFEIVSPTGVGRVKADAGQLEQVVMNLAVNSRDAMPHGGRFRIEIADVELEAGRTAAGGQLIVPGGYVMLAASDTGCGISEEILPKLFEPFFTTKERGKGSGLGLATSYGIVQQAGGFVAVSSEVGRGTTFTIYLPRVAEAVAAPHTEVAAAPVGQTILLVEDEAALLAIARETLQEQGYRVLTAGSPSEAIEIVRRHSGPIHLLVTDVVLPEMDGRALAVALIALLPRLKVLYVSGYTDDIIAHRGVLQAGTRLLAKPFTAAALMHSVQTALGEDAGA